MEDNFFNKHIESQIDDDLTVKKLRVLACDANFDSLLYLCAALVNCKYKVEDAKTAAEAVEILNANKHRFDLVFVDVDTDSSEAFKLVEAIGHEMQLPVIIVTGDTSPENKTKALSHGGVDCIRKRPKVEEIMNTIRHHFTHDKTRDHQNQKPFRLSNSLTEVQEDARSDKVGHSQNGKKKRMVWSPELDAKFVSTVQTLDKKKIAHPKRILAMMNEPGLTRDHVASHLQKYRMALKKRNAAKINDHRLVVPSFSGVHSFSHGSSSLGPTMGDTLMPTSSSSPVPKVPFQSHGFQTSDVYDNYLLETNVEPHILEAEITSQSAPYLDGITNTVQYPDSTVFAVNGVTEAVWNGTTISPSVPSWWHTSEPRNEVSEVDNNYSLPEESFDWRSLLNDDSFTGI